MIAVMASPMFDLEFIRIVEQAGIVCLELLQAIDPGTGVESFRTALVQFVKQAGDPEGARRLAVATSQVEHLW